MMEVLDDETPIPFPIVSTLEDLEYFLGDDKKAYYLESFQSPKLKKPNKVSLNPSAFFFGPLWMAYRRMSFEALFTTYGYAILLMILITFGLSLYLFIPFYVLISVYLGLYGNWHYRKFIDKRILPIKSKEMDRDFEVQAIAKEGGSYYSNSFALLGYWFFIGFLIMFFYFFTKDTTVASKIAFLCLFLVGSLYSTQKFRYS